MTPQPCTFPLDPGERLLIFDGVCKLCSGWAHFILRFDRNAHIRMTTIQSDTGRAILKELGLDTAPLETLVFLENGVACFKTDAIFEVLRQLPPVWRIFLVLRIVPSPFRDWLYVRVARNRYRLFGTRRSCFVPNPSIKERFRD